LFNLAPVQAADIVARTDRATINMNESFTLTFDVHGSPDGDPDFGPLGDIFEIVNTAYMQSSSVNILNNEVNQINSWIVTLSPKQSGALVIPPISFGQDESPEVHIQVNPAQAGSSGRSGEDIFIEVEATPENPYVQQQIIYKVRLYLAVSTSNATLSEPQPSHSDTVIRQLGEDSRYETTRDGRRYTVYERRYTLFPQAAGELVLQPIRFEGVTQTRYRGYFEPFGGNGQRVRLTSDAIKLNVLPIPAEFTGKHWLPASELRFSESWSPDPPAFIVGEPVTRNLAISATGLSAAQLPELISMLPADAFKQYPDQPTLEDKQKGDHALGVRVDKAAIIPTRPGRFTLPAIEIPWWNTRKNVMEIAKLPAREIEVIPGQAGATPTPQAAPTLDLLSPNITASGDLEGPVQRVAGFWPWLSMFLGFGWLATGLIWWIVSHRRQGVITAQTPRPDPRAAVAKLKTACTENNAGKAKTALLDWARIIHTNAAAGSLGAVANITGGQLGEEIQRLNAALYRGENETGWSGEILWQVFEKAEKE
jgi:hypothetical protein